MVLGSCLVALCLTGCGQKGPLYLPDQKPQVVVTGAQPPVTPTPPPPPPKQPTDADDPSQP
jgi:predicted small lipoprotein YifL